MKSRTKFRVIFPPPDMRCALHNHRLCMVLRCPLCGNDLLSVKALNDEQQRVTEVLGVDVQKCEVCDVFYGKETLKAAIFSQ